MNICFFAASSDVDEVYVKAVREFAGRLAKMGHTLVFGGYAKGLMKAAAEGFRENGADIIGVVPEFLETRNIRFPECTKVICTRELSDRKEKMVELSDAFCVMPGGIGTLDEFFDVLAMKNLGRIDGDIALLNVNGYYDSLAASLEEMTLRGFNRADAQSLYRVISSAEEWEAGK